LYVICTYVDILDSIVPVAEVVGWGRKVCHIAPDGNQWWDGLWVVEA